MGKSFSKGLTINLLSSTDIIGNFMKNNWIQFDVRNASGGTALGATVEIVSGDHEQTLIVEPTRSYLSQVDTVLTFGIASRQRVEQARIHWADGHTETIASPAINQRHRVTR